MNNLTDRQIVLIVDLLQTYNAVCDNLDEPYKPGVVSFIFMDEAYDILACDYEKVSEIIDYIKGVDK